MSFLVSGFGGVQMNNIHKRFIKKTVSYMANLTAETVVILAGAAAISGLWYLGFIVKIF